MWRADGGWSAKSPSGDSGTRGVLVPVSGAAPGQAVSASCVHVRLSREVDRTVDGHEDGALSSVCQSVCNLNADLPSR